MTWLGGHLGRDLKNLNFTSLSFEKYYLTLLNLGLNSYYKKDLEIWVIYCEFTGKFSTKGVKYGKQNSDL